MNRYNPIKTEDRKVMILDSIIRLPEEFMPCMTREARMIRESLPEISLSVLRSKNRAAIICTVIGTGWEPLPELPYADRKERGRLYKNAVVQLAEYLEEQGELYDELIVV